MAIRNGVILRTPGLPDLRESGGGFPSPVAAPTGPQVKDGIVRDPVTGQIIQQPQQNQAPALNKIETKTSSVTQDPTNVWSGAQYQIPRQVNVLRNQADNIPLNLPNLQRLALEGRFAMAPDVSGGIDMFGRQAIAEGAQNIFAQNNRNNQVLSDQLSRTPGNRNLLSILQGQNTLRSQLAFNPLYAEGQKGTYERATANAAFKNNAIQLLNSARTTAAGFNNQNELQTFQSRLAAIQPQQNLLEALISLQSQGRGLDSTESNRGAKNFE